MADRCNIVRSTIGILPSEQLGLGSSAQTRNSVTPNCQYLDVVGNAMLVSLTISRAYMLSLDALDESVVILMNLLGKGQLAPRGKRGVATTIRRLHLFAPVLAVETFVTTDSILVNIALQVLHLVPTNAPDVLQET